MAAINQWAEIVFCLGSRPLIHAVSDRGAACAGIVFLGTDKNLGSTWLDINENTFFYYFRVLAMFQHQRQYNERRFEEIFDSSKVRLIGESRGCEFPTFSTFLHIYQNCEKLQYICYIFTFINWKKCFQLTKTHWPHTQNLDITIFYDCLNYIKI